MTNEKNILNSFLKYEKDNKLFAEKIDGFEFWPYIRMDVYNQLTNLKSFDKTKRKKIKIAYNLFAHSLVSNPYKIKNIDILFINSPRKFMGKNNLYEDIYLDDILSKATYKYSILECLDIVTGKHLKPCKNQNSLYYRDYLDTKSFINSLFLKSSNAITIRIYQIIKDIEKAFNKKINTELLVSIINKKYKQWRASKKIYGKFLKKINPKAIVEICSYNTSNMIFNEVAHEQKIPVIELQHGVIGKGHLAYNYETCEMYNFFPDYMFVFSEFWKQNIKLPLEKDRIVATGFPYLEKNSKIYFDGEQKGGEKKNIIFISQPEIREKLFKVALALCEMLSDDYQIIFKLHPSELDNVEIINNELKKSNVKNFKLVEDFSLSIYNFFHISSIQVGYVSTAIYEGLAFNLKTFIYKDELSELYMDDLCKMNYAKYFSNTEELALKIKNTKPKSTIAKEFWAKNSIKNINNTLLKIIGKEFNIVYQNNNSDNKEKSC